VIVATGALVKAITRNGVHIDAPKQEIDRAGERLRQAKA
jgi:hypothetical protein